MQLRSRLDGLTLVSQRFRIENWSQMLGHLVGEADAVNHGDRRQHGQYPEHGSHGSPASEERAQNDEHDPLRPLHEANLALADQRLSPGAGVADHQRSDHDECRQDDVEEAIAAGVEDQQSKEQNDIGVAIDHRIEKRAEDRYLVSLTGNTSVNHVEDASADNHQT